MILNQKYSYDGSDEFDVSQIQFNENGVALFNVETGFGGVDYIPNDGDTVAVIASNMIGTKDQKYSFEPSMNNNIYYLVSDRTFTSNDKDEMISLATPISVSWSGTRYEGTFTYNNPDGLEYLYLIWDYSDNIDNGSAYFEGGGDNVVRFVDGDFGSNLGVAGVGIYTLNKSARYVLKYANSTILDTGYIGLNSTSNYNDLIAAGIKPEDIKLEYPYDGMTDNGTFDFKFKKYLPDGRIQLAIYTPLSSTEIGLTKIPVELKKFYIDINDGNLSNVCSQIPNVNFWHNGNNALPSVGDIIYSDDIGTNVYAPTPTSLHLMTEDESVSPPSSGGVYISVLSNGTVDTKAGCDCEESSVPVITQGDIQVVIGEPVRIIVQADNNPTSWAIQTDCYEYILEGGQKGSYFTYTQCDGCSASILVGYNDSIKVCSTTTPTLVTGDGSIGLSGTCQTSSIIDGLFFNTTDGTITGTPISGGSKELTLVATNCFGDSTEYSFTITSVPAMTMKPFLIDTKNFMPDGTTACSVTSPEFTILYHDCCGELPDLDSTIYTDPRGVNYFSGGDKYYYVSPGTYSYKINQFGQVIDKYNC